LFLFFFLIALLASAITGGIWALLLALQAYRVFYLVPRLLRNNPAGSTTTTFSTGGGQPGMAYAQPVGGQQYAAQPVGGQQYTAQPVQGQPVTAQPVQGQPVQAQPVQGQPAAQYQYNAGAGAQL